MFVAVYFDTASEQKLRDLWAIGQDNGFSPTLATLGVRPHLTIGSWEEMDPDAMTITLRRLVMGQRRFNLTFDAVGWFMDGGSFFLIPEINQALLSLHTTVHTSPAAARANPDPCYTPGRWTPHCTIANNVPADRFGDAAAVYLGKLTPFSVTVEEITLAEANPFDTKAIFPLAT